MLSTTYALQEIGLAPSFRRSRRVCGTCANIPLLIPAVASVLLFWTLVWNDALPTPPNNQSTYHAEEQKPPQKTEQQITEEALAFYTQLLAWFTGGLVIVALLQLKILSRTDETAKRAAETANRQMVISDQQTGILEKQKEIARQEFLATHRPQLEVRFVREVSDGVEITVINTGTGPAHFIAARAELRHLHTGEPLPSPHDLVPGSAFTLRSKFEPSESFRYVVQPDVNPGQAFEAGFGGPLHVFGWIVYSTGGIEPITRTTYFGRMAIPLQPELVHIEGSDWNFIQ